MPGSLAVGLDLTTYAPLHGPIVLMWRVQGNSANDREREAAWFAGLSVGNFSECGSVIEARA